MHKNPFFVMRTRTRWHALRAVRTASVLATTEKVFVLAAACRAVVAELCRDTDRTFIALRRRWWHGCGFVHRSAYGNVRLQIHAACSVG